MSPILLAYGFFKESFKQFTLEIIIDVFKSSKIVETRQNAVEHRRIARNSPIILRYKNRTIDDCSVVLYVSRKQFLYLLTNSIRVEFKYLIIIISCILCKQIIE